MDDHHDSFNPDHMATTRLIDTAVGILVGWRQCSTQAAFRELLAASERQQVPLFAMAGALVNLASRGTDPHDADRAAEREWGDQLSPATADDRPQRSTVDRWL